MAVASGKKEPVVVDQETNEKYEEIKREENAHHRIAKDDY